VSSAAWRGACERLLDEVLVDSSKSADSSKKDYKPEVTPTNPVLPLEAGTALVSEILGRPLHPRHLIEDREASGAYCQTRRWYILTSDARLYGAALLNKEATEGRRYSVSEAAQVLGCTDKVVYARIADRSLAASKVRGRWSITQVAIDTHVREAKDPQ
jgi:excisionase family DNA binding protein